MTEQSVSAEDLNLAKQEAEQAIKRFAGLCMAAHLAISPAQQGSVLLGPNTPGHIVDVEQALGDAFAAANRMTATLDLAFDTSGAEEVVDQ